MHYIVAFFNAPLFIIIGGISTLVIVASFFYTIYLIVQGVIPILFKLGTGLVRGKIAIFAASDTYDSLKSMLVDSEIFKDKNIIKINYDDLKKAETANVFLVHWKDYHQQIEQILALKKDQTALIVYAPQNEGPISPDILNKVTLQRNTVLANFRGRLLNDILTSLMVISYERK